MPLRYRCRPASLPRFCLVRLLEFVERWAWLEFFEALIYGLLGKVTDPQPFEWPVRSEVDVDVSEDRLSFPSGIGGKDDTGTVPE